MQFLILLLAAVASVNNAFMRQTTPSTKLSSFSLKSTNDNIDIAKSFMATNFACDNPSLLDDEFTCDSPFFDGLSKDKYLKGLSMESKAIYAAIPDYDRCANGYTIDEMNPDRVWFRVRPKGTILGEFKVKGEVYPPNQKSFQLPAQQMSVTIKDGKVSIFFVLFVCFGLYT